MLRDWVVQTTLIAAALAAVAGLVGASRWRRVGPEVRHLLWLLVLVKLMVPPGAGWRFAVAGPVREVARVESLAPPAVEPAPLPVAAIEQDPGAGAEPRVVPMSECVADAALPPSPTPAPNPPRWSVPAGTVAVLVWACGSVLVAGWELARVARFGTRLRRAAAPAPAWLEAEVAAVATRFAVRPPPTRVVAGLATPMLWCVGRARLYLPAALATAAPDPDRWRAVIAHELAHLARRDPWVARLELAAEVLWWWHPLFWLARHQVRAEAELACDARVVRLWPEERLPYATMLVEVCARLVRPAASLPAPALGVGGSRAARSLERRLTMILDGPPPRPSRLRAGLALTTLAALALPAWGLAQQPAAEAPAALPASPETSAPPATPAEPAPETKPAGAPEPRSIDPDNAKEVEAEARRRFNLDPAGENLAAQMKRLMAAIKRRQSPFNVYDPQGKRYEEELKELEMEYGKRWNILAPRLREEVIREARQASEQARHTITVLQARRDGKIAELRKAEAVRDLARSTMVRTQKYADRKVVSQDELEAAKTALQIAEAEVDVHKAALVEAEAELQGGQAQPEAGPASATAPASVPDPNAAILQVRRVGKLAELRKAEAARDVAKAAVARNQKFQSKGKSYVSDEEVARAEAELRGAEAEVEIRRAALAEIDLQLGKDQPGPAPAPASPAAGDARPTPPRAEAPASVPPASRDERLVRLRKAEAARELAAAVVVRYQRLCSKYNNYVSLDEIKRAEADFLVADAEVKARKADLGLAENDPPPTEPNRSARSLAELRDELEQAEFRVRQNEISRSEGEKAQAKLERLRQYLQAKGSEAWAADITGIEADLKEVTVRLVALREARPGLDSKAIQARQQVDAELVRVGREAEVAKGRLKWAEDMVKKGYISPRQRDEYRNLYDDLMILIDPVHKPTLPSSPKPEAPASAEPSPAREGR